MCVVEVAMLLRPKEIGMLYGSYGYVGMSTLIVEQAIRSGSPSTDVYAKRPLHNLAVIVNSCFEDQMERD